VVLASIFTCSLSSTTSLCEQPILVVTTTSIIGNTTKVIGGEAVEVRSLMGEGVDPHLYKASPGDLRLLSSAALVLHNGLHLEGKMADALEKLSARKPVVAVTSGIPREQLRSSSDFPGSYDPHVWFDVALWSKVALHIRDTLIEHDRRNESGYRSRYQSFQEELEKLHIWCAAELQKIPSNRRLLITAHDAFGYLGRAYALEVRGIQGLSTDSEASLQDIRFLVDLIVQRQIPAVFVENSVSPKAVQALVEGSRSRGHSLTIGGELYSDTLGPIDSPAGDYIGMVRHNVTTITSALMRSSSDVGTSD
jgi:manganese/zinc/iron transport system substrate-binding protein